jgi:hypothetical protein
MCLKAFYAVVKTKKSSSTARKTIRMAGETAPKSGKIAFSISKVAFCTLEGVFLLQSFVSKIRVDGRLFLPPTPSRTPHPFSPLSI